MKRYYVATFVVVFCLMYCGQSQEEKLESALREVERLDAMRKKVSEVLNEQATNVLRETEEYEEWVDAQNLNLIKLIAPISLAEQQVAYWEKWHLNEAKRLKSVFDVGESMISWERILDDMKARLSRTVYDADTLYYRRMIEGQITHPKMLEIYNRHLATSRDSITQIMAEIEAHENNRPKPSYRQPQKRTDKISEWKKKLSHAQKAYDKADEELKQTDATKRQALEKLRDDLILTKATYDSINVLHTNAVLELSKK